MSIIIQLDIMLKSKKMTAKELAQAIGITEANLSILNSGKAKAIRFSTLEAICSVLNCQPGDIVKYRPD
ncbi:helix-turn-helix transcriptional regulator [Enterobacter sp. BIDMC 29]|jgi:putative transcriptional regulator|uniref:helix-turn-helix domain-containing protein n=1 Tax=Enterobacter sp. BIDMC 29 TaxID=1329841 RepID=UPI0005A48CF5|nr:helix-turn-helix transcriptional regulator [Enterobacter sp. BIDMC 29]